MIWIGILLCLGITSSQGKPSGDASDVIPAKELREADDNQPKIFDLVSGKEKGEQMFQFSIQKRLSVLVRTEDELNWEEARARCQQLGDELEWTESGLHGDLYHFMDEEDDYKYLDSEKQRELAHAFGKIYTRKEEQKNPERIDSFWLGKDPRKDREDSCQFFYGIYGNYATQQSCKEKLHAFLCEFSGKTEEEEERPMEEEEESPMEEREADGTTEKEEANGTTEEEEADGTTEE